MFVSLFNKGRECDSPPFLFQNIDISMILNIIISVWRSPKRKELEKQQELLGLEKEYQEVISNIRKECEERITSL